MSKVQAVVEQTAARRLRLVATAGRGRTGKSLFLRWVAETSPNLRHMTLIDADPNNQSLAGWFSTAVKPPGVDGDDRRQWIEDQIGELVELAAAGTGGDMLLDLGANDQMLKRLGEEVRLAESLEENGVDLVLVHMLGTKDDDLRYLEDVEDRNLLRPKCTVLVLNVGLISGTMSPKLAFERVTQSEVVKRVTSPERGGKLVVMPALDPACVARIEELELTFKEAAEHIPGQPGVGVFNAVRVRKWLEEMAKLRARLGDWLP